MPDVKTMDIADVQAALGKPGVAIVDVRLPFDYFGGRIPGSRNYPGDLLFEHPGQFPADTRMIFVCDDGSQSAEAAAAAGVAGYTDVGVLSGGMDAWFEADLPIETISDGNMQV